MIRRSKQTEEYSMIPNALANDAKLSFEARGVLLYLLAKPANWTVQITDLRTQGKIGKDKAYAIVQELVDAGYVRKDVPRAGTGRFDGIAYVVFDRPNGTEEADQPLAELPFPDFPQAVNPDHIKDRESKKDLSLKKTEAAAEIVEAVNQYNLTAEQLSLSKIIKLTDSRKEHLAVRLRENGPELWAAAMRAVSDSEFLSGRDRRNGRKWKPDFDWFVKPNNFQKLIEGKYHDGQAIGAAPAMSEEDVIWTRRMEAWQKKIWIADWGPAPDMPNCYVPPKFLNGGGSSHGI